MSMLFPYSGRCKRQSRMSGKSPHVARLASGAAILSMLSAALVAGCASKNPLMEEPAASAQSDAVTGVQVIREGRLFGFLSPYRIDIQQGNFVSKEMVSQLRPGMTPDQVRFVLGTPLLTDVFHADRWDYPFLLEKGNGEVIRSRVTLFFKDNRLERFVGGELPAEKDYLARLTGKELPKTETGAAPTAPAAPASPATPSTPVPSAPPGAPASPNDPGQR